ncbi:unnamed protein product [Protopolystoma xenopodis]|uniref:Uncharacterized protein n=1 Tax=Protopolystoma xenopodis TaxID=117903 RepID=A0A3S5CI44_9PLAT|nr:unnamed protein product [Protopolystoma xenopodis]
MGEVFYSIYEQEQEQAATETTTKVTSIGKLKAPGSLAEKSNAYSHLQSQQNSKPHLSHSSLMPSSTPRVPGSTPRTLMNSVQEPSQLTAQKDSAYASSVYVMPSAIQKPENKSIVADDLFARVVEIWAVHLSKIIFDMTHKTAVPEGLGAVVAEITQEVKESLGSFLSLHLVRHVHLFSLILDHISSEIGFLNKGASHHIARFQRV